MVVRKIAAKSGEIRARGRVAEIKPIAASVTTG